MTDQTEQERLPIYRKGSSGGWYIDLRGEGGKREALIPPGHDTATKDPEEARMLARWRMAEFSADPAVNGRGAQIAREYPGHPGASRVPEGGSDPGRTRAAGARFDDYARRYLQLLAGPADKAESTVRRYNGSLRIFRKFLRDQGLGNLLLDEISTTHINDFLLKRSKTPGRGGKGTTIGAQTLRNDVYALSGLFQLAIEEGVLNDNPAARARLPRTTLGEAAEASFLEMDEAAHLLEGARRLDRKPGGGRRFRFMFAIVAVMLLAGLRESETYALRVQDVDFEKGFLHVRTKKQTRGTRRSRRLKTGHAIRVVPLWPQLREILEPHIASLPNSEPTAHVFPADASGERSVSCVRGSFARIVADAGLTDKGVTFHTLRHTYGAARIQTLDHDEPVAMYTVARELGHGGTQLLERRYAHLQRVRHRKPVVEYRLEGS